MPRPVPGMTGRWGLVPPGHLPKTPVPTLPLGSSSNPGVRVGGGDTWKEAHLGLCHLRHTLMGQAGPKSPEPWRPSRVLSLLSHKTSNQPSTHPQYRKQMFNRSCLQRGDLKSTPSATTHHQENLGLLRAA